MKTEVEGTSEKIQKALQAVGSSEERNIENVDKYEVEKVNQNLGLYTKDGQVFIRFI